MATIVKNAAAKGLAPGYARTTTTPTGGSSSVVKPTTVSKNFTGGDPGLPGGIAPVVKPVAQVTPATAKVSTATTKPASGVFGTNASNPFITPAVKNFTGGDPGLEGGNVFTPKKPVVNTPVNPTSPVIDTTKQTQITQTPTVQPIDQFGSATKGWTHDQFVSRNNDLASNFATKNLTNDAQIRSELEKNVNFRQASEQDKLATIADIAQRIPVAQTKIAATSEADAIAKQYNFKDFADFSAKAGADVKNQVQSLINDIAKYKQLGDTEAEAMAKGSLGEIMAQGTVLATAQTADTTQTLAAVSNMNPQGQLAAMKYQLLQDAIKKGVSYDQLPNSIKGTKEDVDNLLNGRWDKMGVQVDDATAQELTAKLQEDKTYNDKQTADATAAQKLQLQRNEEDYQEAFRKQQQENNIMSENMSKLSRFTGIGFSSSGVEGMDYVFQQGQQALSDLTKLHDRSEADIQTALSQISDAYIHNTNLYNLAYKDSMRNATQSFTTDIQNIQNQYGKTSDAAWAKIADVSKTYQTDLANLSKWRTEQQNEMNNQLRQRYKDTQTLKLQQQAQNIDMLKTQGAYPDLFPSANGLTPTQSTPAVDTTTVQKGLETLETKYKDGTTGGQCGAFANNYAETLGLGRIFKDPFTQKASFINSQTPKVGSFVMRDSGAETNGVKNGHLGIVVGISGDDLLIKDSNGELDKNGKGTQKIATRTVSLSKILSKDGGFFDPTIGGTVPGASTDTASLNSLSKQDQDIAKQIAEYDYDPQRLSIRSGKSEANTKTILNAAYEINPDYNMGDYANNKAYKATWNKAIAPAGNLGRVGTAINHLAELQTAIGDLKGQSDLQIQNKIVNGVRKAFGKPGITSFEEAKAAVTSELAGAYKGNASPSEDDRKEWGQTIGVELSPEQFDAWINTAAELLYGKTSTDAFNYQQTLGKKPKSIFNDSAVNFLKTKDIDLSQDYDLGGNTITETPASTSTGTPRRK